MIRVFGITRVFGIISNDEVEEVRITARNIFDAVFKYHKYLCEQTLVKVDETTKIVVKEIK